jgi:hypothetical protein
VPSLVVPTMTPGVPGPQTEGMPPSAEPPADDGPPSPQWQQVQTLGVADVVMTILRARKTMPSATAAAVSRESHGGGFRVRVRLLEDTPSPGGDPGDLSDPGERKGEVAIFVARELGKDLADAFGGKDVIVLK